MTVTVSRRDMLHYGTAATLGLSATSLGLAPVAALAATPEAMAARHRNVE